MIDFTPPPHVQKTVSDIHRFITDDPKPIERELSAHLVNEHLGFENGEWIGRFFFFILRF